MFVAVREKVVYHYGDLTYFAPMYGRMWLYEGDTLSVSLCPSEWLALNPALLPTHQLYEIERIDGTSATFIDLARLTTRNWADINAWAQAQGLGTTTSPNLTTLTSYHGTSIPPQHGSDAVSIAWAKAQDVDGIWFTDPIHLNWPDSSRGGIFQHRVNLFQRKAVALINGPGWPACRRPTIEWL